MRTGRWTLIYDGDCNFCIRQIRWVQSRDVHGMIDTVPFQTADLDAYGVSRTAVEDAMHLVSPSGEVSRGAEAAQKVLMLFPRLRPLALLLRVPGVMFLAERVYRWIAKRRHRFGCDSVACSRGGAD